MTEQKPIDTLLREAADMVADEEIAALMLSAAEQMRERRLRTLNDAKHRRSLGIRLPRELAEKYMEQAHAQGVSTYRWCYNALYSHYLRCSNGLAPHQYLA